MEKLLKLKKILEEQKKENYTNLHKNIKEKEFIKVIMYITKLNETNNILNTIKQLINE